jgi:hypothetical protein
MTEREALRLALEALEDACGNRCNAEYNPCFQRETITTIKQALEQPEPEPVAWMYVNKDGECEQIEHIEFEDIPDDPSITPLYTSPPKREWQGLTDEEIDRGLLRSDYALQSAHAWRAGVVFAITQLKEKNDVS